MRLSRQIRKEDASYREWNIVGQCDVPGFFYLESRFRLNPGEQPATYTEFELCLHESQFEGSSVLSLNYVEITAAAASAALARLIFSRISRPDARQTYFFGFWLRSAR